MARRFPPLKPRQREVLRWISDGCPDGVMQGHTYKTTAIALQGRRLVSVSKRKGLWSATLTPEGAYYLQHGAYRPLEEPPARPAPLVSRTLRPRRSSGRSAGTPASDATVRAMKATTARTPKVLKAKHVEVRETFMRYRVMVTRVQVAERHVRATDEEDAAKKVQEEFDRPYGYFGRWKIASSEVEVVGAEETAVIKQPHPLSPEGPLLLSLKDAGKALGLSYSTVYELVNRGEIEHVMVGSRKYASREALTHFISQNTHRGYHR